MEPERLPILSRGSCHRQLDHSPRREVYVYVSPTQYSVLREDQTLDGGEVLPGFQLALSDLFAEPSEQR